MQPLAGPDPPAAAESPGGPPADTTVEDQLRAADASACAETDDESTVDWDALPDAVRLRLADVTAGAVAGLPGSDLPAAVRPVARFAPAKRARLGGPALLAGLRDSATFRAAVIEWARANRPEALDATASDTASAAAAAVLLGTQDAGEQVAEVARRSSGAQLRAERDAALAKVERLTVENRRLRRELDAATAAAQRAGASGEADASRLRSRLREQGARLRQALDRADEAMQDRDADLTEVRSALAAAEAQRDRERERAELASRRAERAAAEIETARQALREARAADEVRLALLVNTVAGAVAGLRRELALGEHAATGGPRPADLVSGGSPPSVGSGRLVDPAALDRLLALPVVHLVVDGYNVTKTGYPDLTLSDQRDRLIGQLAALAARTGAEITVVFDGAAVVAVPVTASRGVRVLFSDPGVLADDVIRGLVAAEPQGRPVVVVSSDRAIAESVRRCGAYPVPSAVLLTRLNRS
ncbi:MAG: NYN domain-containing protein [Pseudonocardiaceae bacterium]